MMRRLQLFLIAALVVVLTGCVSGGKLVTAAEGVRVFDLQFDTSLDWARSRDTRIEMWTIDGMPLNEFVVISKVRPNEHVFLGAKERKNRPDGPWYRTGMRPDEIRDLLLDALRGDGWSHVSASNLRPARFGTVDGIRFEFELTHGNGLRYRGTYAAAEHGGKLSHWFWLAPAEHYYGRDIAAVNSMFESARFVQ